MRKQNIFDLYNEQHKDDVKAADKLPGEVTPADVGDELEQKAEPEEPEEQKPEKLEEQKPEEPERKEGGEDA